MSSGRVPVLRLDPEAAADDLVELDTSPSNRGDFFTSYRNSPANRPPHLRTVERATGITSVRSLLNLISLTRSGSGIPIFGIVEAV